MTLAKDRLLAITLPTRDVAVDGDVVRVRGLSREEVCRLTDAASKGTVDEVDTLVLTYGMVDPVLTAEEVVAWRRSAPTQVIEPVSDAIIELSGIAEGAQFRGGAAVRPG